MKVSKSLCLILSVALVEVPFALNAHAELPGYASHASMIPTGEVVSIMLRDQNRAKVGEFMKREDVRSQFVKFGVDPNEAAMRVASMSDPEIQKLAGEIDRTPAGADVIVISLTTVLLVVIILLLLKKI